MNKNEQTSIYTVMRPRPQCMTIRRSIYFPSIKAKLQLRNCNLKCACMQTCKTRSLAAFPDSLPAAVQ